MNSSGLYSYGFEKYDVSRTTGIAETELEKAATELISYFNSGDEYINVKVMKNGETFQLFNQREIIHLRDVKRLIRLDYYLFLGTLIYVLGYSIASLFWRKKRYWRQLAWGVASGSSITLALMLVIGLGTLFNFDQLFLQFHLLSFSNDLWLLDPSRDYLIMLFPGGFWYDVAIFCAGITAGLAVILGGVVGGYLWTSRRGTTSTL